MRSTQLQVEPFQWDGRQAVIMRRSSKRVELLWIRSGCALIHKSRPVEELRSHHLVSPGARLELEIVEPVRGYRLTADRSLVTSCLPEPLPPSIRQFLRQLGGHVLGVHFSQRGRAEAEWFLHRLVWEDDLATDVAWTNVRLTLAQFLLLCYRECVSAARDKGAISASGENVVRLLRHYIDQHFHENLSLKDLSQRAGYAPSYLSSLFSKANGLGLSEYISRARIACAQQLLRSCELKVIDICYRVGFRDLAHFNRTFKRFVGIPPNQYRRCGIPGVRPLMRVPGCEVVPGSPNRASRALTG